MTIRENVFGDAGYDTSQKLSSGELVIIQHAIKTQFNDRLCALFPDQQANIKALELSEYHTQSQNYNHKQAWPKKHRILTSVSVSQIRKMKFFQTLQEEFGPLLISDEEKVEEQEVYWRIVRPDTEEDVGPAHADAWFWECGHGEMPPGYDRFKIWIPILSEPGRNGLQIIPGSHLSENYRFEPIMKDGMLKPAFIGDENEAGLQLLPLNPGNMLIFHDRLIHKGAVNRGSKTRISLEMTCLYKNE